MPSSPAEKSLADLAITSIGDKLPSLLPFMTGFELVTKNDESSRAAGLLGFDIGGSQVMMPVLFLSGKLKGMDALYLRDSDTFVSASPEWVEFLTSRSNGVTGEPGRGSHLQGVPSQSLRLFNQPPQVAKRAELDSMFEEFINPAKALAPDSPSFTVPNALRGMGKQACVGFMRHLLQDFPELLLKMAEFYPDDELKVKFEDDRKPKTESKQAKFSEQKLAFVTLDQVYETPERFTVEQKEAVFRDGLSIIDKRAADEKSEVYSDDYSQKFHTPIESGFYKMINAYGELRDVFIAHNPFLLDKPGQSIAGCLIVDAKTGHYYLPIRGEEVLVRSKRVLSSEDFEKEFKGLSKISSAAANKSYIAISPKGEVSAPFDVNSKEKTPDYSTLRVDTLYAFDSRVREQRQGNEGYGCYPRSSGHLRGTTVRLVDIPSARVRHLGETVVVPSDWKILEVDNSCDQEIGFLSDSDSTYEARKAKRDAHEKKLLELKPGSLAVLTQAIQDKSIKALEMKKIANHYTIFVGDKRTGRSTPLLSKNAAVVALTSRFGFGVDDAQALISEVSQETFGKRWMKLADQYSGMPFPDASQYTGSNDLGVPETQTVSEQMEVPIEHPPFPDAFDPDLANFDKIKQTDVDFLSRAADANAKNVFDPAMIGTILKSSRTQAQVDQWLPDLVGALDKLCRLSLLFYWKNSDFANMYGADQMAEFEDVMLNAIKVQGTIVLFLKQRADEGSTGKVDALRGGQ